MESAVKLKFYGEEFPFVLISQDDASVKCLLKLCDKSRKRYEELLEAEEVREEQPGEATKLVSGREGSEGLLQVFQRTAKEALAPLPHRIHEGSPQRQGRQLGEVTGLGIL